MAVGTLGSISSSTQEVLLVGVNAGEHSVPWDASICLAGIPAHVEGMVLLEEEFTGGEAGKYVGTLDPQGDAAGGGTMPQARAMIGSLSKPGLPGIVYGE